MLLLDRVSAGSETEFCLIGTMLFIYIYNSKISVSKWKLCASVPHDSSKESHSQVLVFISIRAYKGIQKHKCTACSSIRLSETKPGMSLLNCERMYRNFTSEFYNPGLNHKHQMEETWMFGIEKKGWVGTWGDLIGKLKGKTT